MLASGDLGFTEAWQSQLFMATILLGMVFLGLALIYLVLRGFFSRWLFSKTIIKTAGVYLLVQATLLIATLVVVALWSRKIELHSIWQHLSLIAEALLEEWAILLPASGGHKHDAMVLNKQKS